MTEFHIRITKYQEYKKHVT